MASIAADYQNFQNLLVQIGQGVDVEVILKVLSFVTPDYIAINSVSVSGNKPSTVTIQGVVNREGYKQEIVLSEYNLHLANSGIFSNVEPYQPAQIPGVESGYPFQITCTI